MLSDVSPEDTPASLRGINFTDVLTVVTGSADKELIRKQLRFIENVHSQSAADGSVIAPGAPEARDNACGY